MAKAKPKAKAPAKKGRKKKTDEVVADEEIVEAKSGRTYDGLIIVESPAKAKTIKKYLGRNYDVKASIGHIKDLPKSKLGVDIDKDFEPTYEVIKGKKKTIAELKSSAHRAAAIYLAPDPDREGEAIAWHLAEELEIPKSKLHRILLKEITKPSVLAAIQSPQGLNKDLYESQQARRILDRLVGYKISPILWTKVRRGLSAGRVQSVAVRLIVDREKEIRAFVPQDYWSIEALLKLKGDERSFVAKLSRMGEEKVERLTIQTQEVADEVLAQCEGQPWKVAKITKKERRRRPYPPFITSTLQQEASKKLFFTAKRTMRLAQQLYEGIELGAEGAQGLITYMRTDSLRISDQAIAEARAHLESNFGKEYLPPTPNFFKNKRSAQDAHEAIRPTSTRFTPEFVKPFLDADQFKLYQLIWRRYLACQAEQAVFDQTSVDFDVKGKSGKDFGYRTTGSILKFPGFLAIYQVEEDSNEEEGTGQLPEITEQSQIHCKEIKSEKHQTQPPPRFAESSLIKELEEKGIGRPSTYASILSTIQDRKYVEKRENRFYPTELGELVNELLVENFEKIVDVDFTANMESQLDDIEEGRTNWVKTLSGFYDPFAETLQTAQKKMRNVKLEETPTEILCPKCSKTLVIKWGRHGKFLACQGYPDCRFTSEFEQDEDGKIRLAAQMTTDEKCEKCDSPMVVKTGRFGKFLACSAYPNCKFTKAITTGISCPECGKGELAEKRTRFGKPFYSCTQYPTCKYAIWDKPLKGQGCPQCHHPFLVQKYTKKEGASVRCPQKECGYQQAVQEAATSEDKTADQ